MSGDFMITGDNGAQDALLDCAFAAAASHKIKVHGRMLGGGGGGNVLVMVDTSDHKKRSAWETAVKDAYAVWADRQFPGQGIRATVIVPSKAVQPDVDRKSPQASGAAGRERRSRLRHRRRLRL